MRFCHPRLGSRPSAASIQVTNGIKRVMLPVVTSAGGGVERMNPAVADHR